MDKPTFFQAIFLIALVLALLPRVAGLLGSVSLWLRYAAFGVLGVGLVWALVELALWAAG